MLNLLHRTCKDMTDIGTKATSHYLAAVTSRICQCGMVVLYQKKYYQLQQIQRKATRFNLSKEYSENKPLSKLSLLPLQYRREINECFKNMNNLHILDFVSFRTCSMALRKVDDYLTLDVPFSSAETLKNSYFIQVCRSWNELPLKIRKSNTLSIFRTKLLAYVYDTFSANFLS